MPLIVLDFRSYQNTCKERPGYLLSEGKTINRIMCYKTWESKNKILLG
ncbi:hypothetical protein HMPREF0381_0138 [Lachnoanaerobaculum saburreum DSM 3986]|uniref:Uncharacterized protein n=1 Tax=Lachnoanaerobaculum saburreum DSM 3986 TaxID=887325 RepID=E6LJK3_9FIRM|nr:hypothetical protein HMPREF0381_0138 [Lachnoanaerobaculum saburreum DSM 3986]